MQKVYFDDLKASSTRKVSPSKATLNNILAFSKSLEVVKTKKKHVEITLN